MEVPGPSGVCMICGENVDLREIESHVNSHLDEDEIQDSVNLALAVQASEHDGNPTSAETRLPETSGSGLSTADALAQSDATDWRSVSLAAFLDPSAEDAVGEDISTDVVRRLAAQYKNTVRKGILESHLASNFDMHSTTAAGVGWDCGYRNAQMMLSSLLKNDSAVRTLLTAGGPCVVPKVGQVQLLIEAAWNQGFDVCGASHFGGRLRGRRVWIGAVEVLSMLRGLGINAQVVDFHTKCNSDRERLVRWCWNYFRGRCRLGSCAKCSNPLFGRHETFVPPLYLQGETHSRTVIGVEKSTDGVSTLIVADPLGGYSVRRRERSQSDGQLPARSLCSALKSGDLQNLSYQIVYVQASPDDIARNRSTYESGKIVVGLKP